MISSQNFANSIEMTNCVYTVLLGSYEDLNEQPVAHRSSIPFVCLTDDPALRSDSWMIRLVEPMFAHDPVRSQRDLKIRPHIHLGDVTHSLYIDNSVILKAPPERLFDLAAANNDALLMPPHSFRARVIDEFMEVVRLELDNRARILEQLEHYMRDCLSILDERPWWTGMMLRDHSSQPLQKAMEIWAQHVMRYSRRDQLSINLALQSSGVTPSPLDIDNHESAFHSWPHVNGRRERDVRNAAHGRTQSDAQWREAEQELRRFQLQEDISRWIGKALRAGLRLPFARSSIPK